MPRGGKSGKSAQNKAIQAKIQAKFGKTSSRTGGRGSVRRKRKAPPKSSLQDDKRLQGQLKKLNVNTIPAIEEVNLFKEGNTVVHFTKPKVQAEIASNTYVISGQCETKKLEELIPQIFPQLGREHIDSLKNFANSFKMNPDADEDDDVPVLVNDTFEAVAQSDIKTETEKTDDADNENPDANAADAPPNNENDDTNAPPAADAQDAEDVPPPDADDAPPAAAAPDADASEANDSKQESAKENDVPALVPKEEAQVLEPDKGQEASV